VNPSDLNQGLIVGFVVDSIDGSPLTGARAVLTRIVNDPGLPFVRTYWPDGRQDDTVWAETDNEGEFFLTFGWEPEQEGNLLDTNPPYHLSVISPFPGPQYQTQRIYDHKLCQCVSLRRVADGLIPDFRKLDSIAKSIGNEALKRAMKIKRIPLLRIMRPSTEVVALLGFVQVSLQTN
jgi:hypothetical protein